MSSSPHTWRQPAGLAVLVILAAILLFLAMRALAPLRDTLSPGNGTNPPITTSTPPVVYDPDDGKPADPSDLPPPGPQDPPIAVSPVRPLPEGSVCDDLHYICVSTPKVEARLTNPTQLTGTAIAFENTVQWRVEDASKNLLARGFVTTDASDVGRAGDFTVNAFWERLPASTTGTVTLYEDSAKDGQPVHVLTIPVRFAPTTLMTRKIYLAPPTAEAGTDCTQVVALDRSIPSTLLPVEATLRALLREPLALGESSVPYSTIPEGTRLISVVVSGGTAKVVLSNELETYGGGSCRVGAIRAQIERTLMQFSSVRRVEISVPGKTAEETLQP